MNRTEEKYNYPLLIAISLVAALGGLLFGYDWVVIGGAKPFYEEYFSISEAPISQGWAMSSALVGCIVGATIAGVLADRLGRKILLISAAALFSISAYGTGASTTFQFFILYRIIGGLGIGIASTLSPMYIAEIAPSKTRGLFVSINQLTIVIGILAAQITNMLITEPIPDQASPLFILNSWNGQSGWRWMFWAELFPALAFLILMFFIPESPRFLAQKKHYKQATQVLKKIGGVSYANHVIENIKLNISRNSTKVSFKELTDRKVFPVLLIGVVLAAFQQWCGINIIFNYAQEIFTSAGYSINDLYMNIVITGGINLLFTIIAMLTVDRFGRKKLMLLGAGTLTIIYGVLGYFYFIKLSGMPLLILVLLAIAVYAVSLAPVTWVVLSEIFPNRIRGMAMAISTFSLWLASAILVQTFPYLNDHLNTSGTFWLYGLICGLGFLFIFFKLPETKNKSLEAIEEEFISKN